MHCPVCGATLRETAIFCHRCGRKLATQPDITMPLAPGHPADLPDESPVSDETAQTEIVPVASDVAEPAPGRSGASRAERNIRTPPALRLPFISAQVRPPAPIVPPSPPADDLEMVIAAETMEWPLDATRQPATQVAVHEHLSPLPDDTIIAERYQIMRLVEQDDTGNVYQVHDLWADDHCWECRSPLGAGDEQFCSQCGAERRPPIIFLHEGSPTHLGVALEESAPTFIFEDRLYAIVTGIVSASEIEPESAPQESLPEPELPTSMNAGWPSSDDVDEVDQARTMEVPTAPAEAADEAHSLFFTPELLGLTPQRESVDMQTEAIAQNEAPTIETMILNAEQWQPRPTPEAGMQGRASEAEPPSLAPDLSAAVALRLGIASDVGRARRGRANEDTAIVTTLTHAGSATPAPLTICVVADGLGGHDEGQRAGRLAARIIVSQVMQHLWLPALAGQSALEFDPVGLGNVLLTAIQEANTQILGINIAENCDMGCTVTALIAQGSAACAANVGDSRTYRFNAQGLSRVTIDHSLVARLVAAGMLRPDDVYTHPQRSQIYRSLGDEAEIPIDLFPLRLEPGETFILCSDGLWEMVRDPDLAQILSDTNGSDPQSIAEQLINVANDHGGEDNVSVIVAQAVAL